jgi:hypothetical protein
MKIPAVWMASAFAAGVALAGHCHLPLRIWIAATAIAIAAGVILALHHHTIPGATFALLAWFALGGTALSIERAALPANHISRLIAGGQLDTNEPLRWRGRLRENPIAFPWGTRYEIDLEEVEASGTSLPVRGGLRANLYNGPRTTAAPDDLRAGDRVEALLRARPRAISSIQVHLTFTVTSRCNRLI